MIAGQSLWDTFMFRPSPPAGPRSLKVTFTAFSVSIAQRCNVMLPVEAAYLLSGLAPREGHSGQLWLLSFAYTFSVLNWSWHPWWKKCLPRSNNTQTKAEQSCKSCAHFNFVVVRNRDVGLVEGSKLMLAFENINGKHQAALGSSDDAKWLWRFSLWRGILLKKPESPLLWVKRHDLMSHAVTMQPYCKIVSINARLTSNCRVDSKSWTWILHNGCILHNYNVTYCIMSNSSLVEWIHCATAAAGLRMEQYIWADGAPTRQQADGCRNTPPCWRVLREQVTIICESNTMSHPFHITHSHLFHCYPESIY